MRLKLYLPKFDRYMIVDYIDINNDGEIIQIKGWFINQINYEPIGGHKEFVDLELNFKNPEFIK